MKNHNHKFIVVQIPYGEKAMPFSSKSTANSGATPSGSSLAKSVQPLTDLLFSFPLGFDPLANWSNESPDLVFSERPAVGWVQRPALRSLSWTAPSYLWPWSYPFAAH